uniref:Retrotransposon Copia-like N-terminal domain-containing protein n=1 Tax=Cajanus cajan TaxID=3821 RepID=A0A151TQU0_CAJCA|nr:hypothetical protein KK1_008608 [Cajanus cajan]
MAEVIDPSQDLSSPYHVSSSDNPSFLIVPNVLEGPNYHHWSHSFRMSLISKNKISFIDGTIEAPTRTSSLFPAWQRANMLVVSWMLKAICPSIAQSIICMDNAFDIWNDLKDRFSQGDMIRISDLQEMISSFKQGSGYGRGSYGRGNASKICSHYGKTGHTIDTCYRKHGFPPHFKF